MSPLQLDITVLEVIKGGKSRFSKILAFMQQLTKRPGWSGWPTLGDPSLQLNRSLQRLRRQGKIVTSGRSWSVTQNDTNAGATGEKENS